MGVHQVEWAQPVDGVDGRDASTLYKYDKRAFANVIPDDMPNLKETWPVSSVIFLSKI